MSRTGHRLWRGPARLSKGDKVAKFMVLWQANAALWPTDPKQTLAVIEAATGAASEMIKAGLIKEQGWFTPQEGYGIFESDSKATILGLVQGFFPYFNQEIREIVPWDEGVKAIVESARQNASR